VKYIKTNRACGESNLIRIGQVLVVFLIKQVCPAPSLLFQLKHSIDRKKTHQMVFYFFIEHICTKTVVREFLISMYNIFVQDMNLQDVCIIENVKQVK
jgi:hypothetical protein